MHKSLSPIATIKVVAPSIMNNEKGTSLYNLMEIDKEMVLLMVKE
jgi:hypothetical protein